MLKLAGLLLIVISASGLGFSKSAELGRREKALQMFLRMILFLQGEIRFGNASLHDAFCGAAGRLPGEYGAFLKETARAMAENTGQPLGGIFRECAERHFSGTALTGEEREKLFSMGEHLGYLDLALQLKQLELLELELTGDLKQLQAQMPGKRKLYQSLGVLGGLLLAVLVW